MLLLVGDQRVAMGVVVQRDLVVLLQNDLDDRMLVFLRKRLFRTAFGLLLLLK